MRQGNKLQVIQENLMPHFRLLASLLITSICLAPAISAEDSEHDDHEDENRLIMDSEQRNEAGIEVITVNRQSLEIWLSAPGEVIPNAYDSAIVSPRIQAQVVARHVRLGDHVETGRTLVTLSSVAMAESQGELIITDREWQRVKSLGKAMLSDQRYSQAQVARQQAMARVLAYGMSAEEAASLLRQNDASRATGAFDLLAPQDGTVIRDDFIVGELIEPGRPIIEIINELQMWVEAMAVPQLVSSIEIGTIAQISPDGTTWRAGKVVQIHHQIQESTRTQAVRIQVQNHDDWLHPGQFVRVEVAGGGGEPVLAIPSDAIILFEGSTVAFRLDQGNEFSPVIVETGDVAGGWTEIRTGLAENDAIAAGGVFLLKSLLLKSSMGEGHVH